MTVIKPEAAVDGELLDLSRQAVFASRGKYLLTSGEFERLDLRASDYHPGSGALSSFLYKKLAAAERAGVNNPVVVGAFPFDDRQAARLYVPRATRLLTTKAFQHCLSVASASRQLPKVASCNSVPSAEGYMASVSQAKRLFEQTALKKVVLSQSLDVDTEGSISRAAVLSQLVGNNRQGYHFSVPLDSDRVLMGVSPELLLRKMGHAIESNPLAGSRKRDPDPDTEQDRCLSLLSSEKDSVEHRYVTESIKQRLSPLCQSLRVPDSPTLLSTDTMWHLSSHIDGVLVDDRYSALELACLLHPTPAVGGSPRQAAKSAISALESFDRGFFAGTLGWMDARGNGEWVVTIRCAVVADTRARLYAGAGVVAASSPAEELAEIEAKLKTMKDAFGFAPAQDKRCDSGEVYAY